MVKISPEESPPGYFVGSDHILVHTPTGHCKEEGGVIQITTSPPPPTLLPLPTLLPPPPKPSREKSGGGGPVLHDAGDDLHRALSQPRGVRLAPWALRGSGNRRKRAGRRRE